jgi:hypothetical protein
MAHPPIFIILFYGFIVWRNNVLCIDLGQTTSSVGRFYRARGRLFALAIKSSRIREINTPFFVGEGTIIRSHRRKRRTANEA